MKTAFPDNEGSSPRNSKSMRAVADAWRDEGFVQGVYVTGKSMDVFPESGGSVLTQEFFDRQLEKVLVESYLAQRERGLLSASSKSEPAR